MPSSSQQLTASQSGEMIPRTRREAQALTTPPTSQDPPASRRGTQPRSPRIDDNRRAFTATLRALDTVAASGGQVSIHVVDLDRGNVVVAGDDHRTLPIAGLGAIALLLEVAAQFQSGKLDRTEKVDRSEVNPQVISGVWNHLATKTFTIGDLAVLVAATGDAMATNALLQRVGLTSVRQILEALNLTHLAMLDGFRDERGPDDAPHVAVGATRETAMLFAALVNSRVIEPAVSAQVSEWLSLNQDLSLVGSAMGLDPYDHEADRHQILFINKTGRDDGVRAEAGVIAGPRAGVAYAITVCFDDLSIMHRVRVHEALHAFGVDLMEYVF